jgi:hypothetical protein
MSGVTPSGHVPGHSPIDHNHGSSSSDLRAAWLASDPDAVPVGAQSISTASTASGIQGSRGGDANKRPLGELRAKQDQEAARKPQTKNRKLITSLLKIKGNSLFKQSLNFMGTTNRRHAWPINALSFVASAVVGLVGAVVFAVPSFGNKLINLYNGKEQSSITYSGYIKDRISNTTDSREMAQLYKEFGSHMTKRGATDPQFLQYQALHAEALEIAKEDEEAFAIEVGETYDPTNVQLSKEHKGEIMDKVLGLIDGDLDKDLEQAQRQKRTEELAKLKKLYPELNSRELREML